MKKEQHHIIYSNSVELEFYNQKENLFIQNYIADLVKDKLLPAMESLFDEQTAYGKTIRIESLELDLGALNQQEWEYSFVNETIYQLRQKLNEIVSFSTAAEIYEVSYKDDQPLVNNIQSTDEAINSFQYFLQSGTLPWNAYRQSANDLLNIILEATKRNELSEMQRRKIFSSIFYTDETLKRFLLQSTDVDISAFLLTVLKIANIKQLVDQYHNIPGGQQAMHRRSKIIAWLLVLFHYYTETNVLPGAKHIAVIASVLHKEFSILPWHTVSNILAIDKKLAQLLQQQGFAVKKNVLSKNIQEKQENAGDIKAAGQQKKRPFEKLSTGYFVNNAGLVILSPFLKQMFINLGLSTAKEFVSEAAQQHAVLLSQYLITEETQIGEHELLMNKIICGYPVNKTLPSVFEVPEDEKAQCRELLQSVLEYWKELKTTKAESLLNTYILRNGKLVDKGEYWLLQIEYNAVDVMLRFLPWSIGIIYLPWMQKRLMVEWRA